jgi:4-hydroxybenzoate polyprenyltransferase
MMNLNVIFQLIRLPNLIILAGMQMLLRYALAQPVMMLEGRPLLLNTEEFLLLVFSCVCVAAGGYIINDIEDRQIDALNKPAALLVGKSISEKQALGLYFIFTIAGILTGFYLSYFRHIQYIGTINAVTAGLLYFYATSYKCIPLLGNIIIALLTALAVFIIAFPEPLILNNPSLFGLITGYAFFAFLLTLIRELIKDLEDEKGDAAAGCRTLVIASGSRIVKSISIALIFLTVVMLIAVQIISRQWEALVPFLYLILFVELPLIYLAMRLHRSHNSQEYHRSSSITKLIMLGGICSMIVFYFSFR